MTKIVPSPDWFVGLSSVELCNNGGFIKSHVEEVCLSLMRLKSAKTTLTNAIKAFPLDAGTDNGFTFTSPNWETEPRGEVFQITNRFLLLRTNLPQSWVILMIAKHQLNVSLLMIYI